MSDEFAVVTMLGAVPQLEAPIAGQGQTVLLDECVRAVKDAPVFSKPPRLPSELHGRGDAGFRRLGSITPRRLLAPWLNALAT
jgi:hypothetical protein